MKCSLPASLLAILGLLTHIDGAWRRLEQSGRPSALGGSVNARSQPAAAGERIRIKPEPPRAASRPGQTTAPRLRVYVAIHDYYGIKEHWLKRAELDAEKPFERIGLRLLWCRSFPEVVEPGSCDGSSASYPELDLNFIAWHQHDSRKLGSAPMSEKGESTSIAYIYVAAAVNEAKRADMWPEQFLGCVIAHELGHLLLPGRGHSSTGLMHGFWSDGDLRAATKDGLQFTPDEGAAIRTEVFRRMHQSLAAHQVPRQAALRNTER